MDVECNVTMSCIRIHQAKEGWMDHWIQCRLREDEKAIKFAKGDLFLYKKIVWKVLRFRFLYSLYLFCLVIKFTFTCFKSKEAAKAKLTCVHFVRLHYIPILRIITLNKVSVLWIVLWILFVRVLLNVECKVVAVFKAGLWRRTLKKHFMINFTGDLNVQYTNTLYLSLSIA